MDRFIENYNGREYDIIIIGGGISGSAVAYEASARGYSVALIDKCDFGCGTSSATSKLIHGGLRYLRNFEISLVRESLRERRILENIAPNFVYPIGMMMPTYRNLASAKFIMRTGLIMYDMLSYDKKNTWDNTKRIPNHISISKKEALQIEPDINPESLTGGMIFYDCQNISPDRLTLAFLKSAIKNNTNVSNYAEVVDFTYKAEKKISGVWIRDNLSGKKLKINGKIVINCGGPWADIILNKAEKGQSTNHIKRSEGIHIITPLLGKGHALLLRTKKGGHFFVLPWRNHSLIGTTDKEYNGDPDAYKVTKESIEEFIRDINETYAKPYIKYEDIKHAYGGLRPIADTETKGTYASSRKYEIHDNRKDGFEGLVTVEGGKYTTSRNLAVNTVDLIDKKMKRETGPSATDINYLSGCEIKDLLPFIEQMKNTNKDFSKNTIDILARYYGTELEHVLKIAREHKNMALSVNADGEILAQVAYAARHEMAKKLMDILLRRTGMGTLGHPGNDVLKKIANIAASELGWAKDRVKEEINEVNNFLRIPQTQT